MNKTICSSKTVVQIFDENGSRRAKGSKKRREKQWRDRWGVLITVVQSNDFFSGNFVKRKTQNRSIKAYYTFYDDILWWHFMMTLMPQIIMFARWHSMSWVLGLKTPPLRQTSDCKQSTKKNTKHNKWLIYPFFHINYPNIHVPKYPNIPITNSDLAPDSLWPVLACLTLDQVWYKDIVCLWWW